MSSFHNHVNSAPLLNYLYDCILNVHDLKYTFQKYYSSFMG